MNEIIQSLWIGRPLSLIEQLSITSFLKNGHEFHLYCYEEIKNVPCGTTLRDAAEVLPASEIFYYRRGKGKGSVAAFSNLFRYKLLLEKGGWWVDTDVVCLRPFDFARPLVIASERNDTAFQTSNAAMRLPPGNAIARSCYDIAVQADRATLAWGKIGPQLLDRIVREAGLQQCVEAPEVFCPLDYWKWAQLMDNSGAAEPSLIANSHAIHLWHELWRRAGLKTNLAKVESQLKSGNLSILAGLIRRYLPDHKPELDRSWLARILGWG